MKLALLHTQRTRASWAMRAWCDVNTEVMRGFQMRTRALMNLRVMGVVVTRMIGDIPVLAAQEHTPAVVGRAPCCVPQYALAQALGCYKDRHQHVVAAARYCLVRIRPPTHLPTHQLLSCSKSRPVAEHSTSFSSSVG